MRKKGYKYGRLTLPLWLAGLAVLCIPSFGLQQNEQKPPAVMDSIQFPEGYLQARYSALEQLMSYPFPRYQKGNKLHRLFNWIDPFYMGGNGQPGVNKVQAVTNAVALQEELGLNWNYCFVIPNTKMAGSEAALKAKENPTLSYIKLANKYPQVPLGVITFWMQMSPKVAGFSAYPKPLILTKDLDERLYLYRAGGKGRKIINYSFPDSLIAIDGHTQKFYLQNIISKLTRPIDIINENGEEPPGAEMLDLVKLDPQMKKLKDSLGYSDWSVFAGKQKLRMRNKYVSSFMDELPELKETQFTWYAIEGGPQDRFPWYIMKKCMKPINGHYYSTPDFYPRWPRYWRDGKGAWHGWSWISSGRRKEISEHDSLFSPFVSPGWSRNPEEDIRPSQWLGLLKCLGGLGAEFYYVGYFNGGRPPYSDPRQYCWQAAVASYAQAVTSRYEDILRNGHLLKGDDNYAITQYKADDAHALVVARKHNTSDRYVIIAALEVTTNEKGYLVDKKMITTEIDGMTITLEARKQGSVYILDKSDPGAPVFFQLDGWHETAHPDHWSHDFLFEGEVSDDGLPHKIVTEKEGSSAYDFSKFTSYIRLEGKERPLYRFSVRDSSFNGGKVKVKLSSAGGFKLVLTVNGKQLQGVSGSTGIPG